MAAKKDPKIVQITPQGAVLWDSPEPVQLRVEPSPFGRLTPQYRGAPSPARLRQLRGKYSAEWHKGLDRPTAALNAAERYVAGLDGNRETPHNSLPLT